MRHSHTTILVIIGALGTIKMTNDLRKSQEIHFFYF